MRLQRACASTRSPALTKGQQLVCICARGPGLFHLAPSTRGSFLPEVYRNLWEDQQARSLRHSLCLGPASFSDPREEKLTYPKKAHSPAGRQNRPA